jgi:cell division septal protein FtsQ
MPSTRPSAGNRSVRRRRALRPAVVAVIAFSLLCGGSYLAARETSLFALSHIEVAGADAGLRERVRATLDGALGQSLVVLDPADAEVAVEAIPQVRTAAVDRRFPHALRVDVVLERPVAVLRRGKESWLIASTTRVLSRVERGALPHLPRIWLRADAEPLEPGARLTEEQGAVVARALADVPTGFPTRILAARGSLDELELVLAGKTALRLGEAADIRLKLRVAAAVLKELRHERAPAISYLDVSLPSRPVTDVNPQVEGLA